jgi:hypothetical protein
MQIVHAPRAVLGCGPQAGRFVIDTIGVLFRGLRFYLVGLLVGGVLARCVVPLEGNGFNFNIATAVPGKLVAKFGTIATEPRESIAKFRAKLFASRAFESFAVGRVGIETAVNEGHFEFSKVALRRTPSRRESRLYPTACCCEAD